MYTLILADDHQFLLEGIQTILKEEIDFKIITTVQNGYQLIDAVRSKKPESCTVGSKHARNGWH